MPEIQGSVRHHQIQPSMDKNQFKAIRKRLGISQAMLAEQLGLGATGARTIQRIEHGAPITGPMALAMQKLDADQAAATRG